jgi:transcriptional regulator with XRE-family HTH domain
MAAFNTPEEWIKDVYETRRLKNSSYSMRAFARDLKVSQTLISFIWNGKRPLTFKVAKKIQENLMLPEKEVKELFNNPMRH